MKVLFDQGTPAPLRRALVDHQVDLARELGWHTLKNGELLDSAERLGYDILVTTDQSLQYQQNLSGRRLAILVVAADWRHVQRQIEAIKSAVRETRPGAYLEILGRNEPEIEARQEVLPEPE